MTAGSSPPVVVLTGGIASGKSAASDHFARLGVPVIDTDVLAREVVAPGTSGLAAVVGAFGTDILGADGKLDRKRLGRRIFSDAAARQQLEALLHPRIEAAARDSIRQLENPAYCLLVVPLLVETGLFADADRVVVVDLPEEDQLERLRRRDDMDEDTARRMLAAQASRRQRLARADEVIDNRGSIEALRSRVERLHEQLMAEFS